MTSLPVRLWEPSDETGAGALVAAYPYNDLRRYRLVGRDGQAAWLKGKVAGCLAEGNVWVSGGGGEVRALIGYRPLPWDSSIFDLTMGYIPVFLHGGDAAGTEPLLDALLARCRADGVKHLNVKVDADDLALARLLESRGFYLVDSIVTYIFIPRRQELPHLKELFKTRLYAEADREAVLQVADEAYRGFIGRYHADPHLPNDRCDTLYRKWAEQLVGGGLAETIIVAERRGKVIGFLGYRMKKDILQATGVKVVGGGLGGCRKEGFGAYAAIIEGAMREGMHRYDMQDFETQLNNVNIIRIYQKLNFEYARAKYTFHAWLS